MGFSVDTIEEVEVKRKKVRRIFGYPITIPFIISNEFCERFSYYGMRTILTIYFVEKIGMSDTEATNWFHEYAMLCYATPIIGALIADIFIGKFLTILILSMVYILGNLLMSISSVGKYPIFQANSTTMEVDGIVYDDFKPKLWGPILALHLIALGTGGIKPCVSSFGGDQFQPSETGRMQRYFSMFYFSVNAGSMVATLLTPELRMMGCMGEATCYPMAFGVPAAFMLIAVVAFVTAGMWYAKVPPQGNPIVDVAKVTWTMFFGSEDPVEKFGEKKYKETRQLWRVLAVFIPLPFFWALFDQQSSRWVLQARVMNGNLTMFGDTFEIKPDQMQALNPIFILALIPVFEGAVYPIMKKIGLPTSATFRIILGMTITSCSFIICGFLQIAMEGKVSSFNEAHGTKFTVHDLPNQHQIHVLAQIPMIFVITCGEILTSITVLEFAYSYAPPSMKSVCQSLSLMTTAFGNLVVIIFNKVTEKETYLFFMWAVIVLLAAVLQWAICKKMQGPLDEYRENELEGKNDGTELNKKESGV